MGNSILTIDMITRKALEILENNLVVTRTVNRQYDSSFAVEGAKMVLRFASANRIERWFQRVLHSLRRKRMSSTLR